MPLTCIHVGYVAYCVDPDCRCLDRNGVLIKTPLESPQGYKVECIQVERGPDGPRLCDKCWAEYLEDPTAYIDYGDHPAGIARWAEVEEMMLESSQYTGYAVPCFNDPDPEIPF